MPRYLLQNYLIVFCLVLVGCHKSDPAPDFKVSGTQKAAQITNFSLNFAAKTEFWDFGDSTTMYSSNSITNQIAHTYTRSGTFVVTVTADKHTVSKTITIQPNYTISYSGSPVVGDTIYFHFPAALPTGNSYSWSFGDGSSAAEPTSFHVYATRGDYNVTFYVNGGLASSVSALHIFNDPLYTSSVAGTRTYHGVSWVSSKAGDTSALPDKSITVKYINKVTLSVGYINYTFNEQFSSDNELYYTTKDNSRDLDRIYYNRSKDSISINTSDLYGNSGAPDVIYRYYHAP